MPVEEPRLQAQLRSLLDTSLADNRQAWDLTRDGTYVQRHPGNEPERATHKSLQRDPWAQVRDSKGVLAIREPEPERESQNSEA